MPDIGSLLLKKYGIYAIIGVIIFASAVWYLTQLSAAPGTEVSVLWGFVKYTKGSSKLSDHTDANNRSIKLYDYITSFDSDSIGTMINKKYAPFQVRVKGEVSNAMDSYVYLVVNDNDREWVQPGLGEHIDSEFSGICSLGAKDNIAFLGRTYTVSAVITNKKYQEFEVLDRSTVLAQSNKIELIRIH